MSVSYPLAHSAFAPSPFKREAVAWQGCCYIQGSHASWQILESPWFIFLKFQDLESPGKWYWSWRVLGIKVLEYNCGSNLPTRIGPSLGSYLLKQCGNKFRNIWCFICNHRHHRHQFILPKGSTGTANNVQYIIYSNIYTCNACGYCIFVYSALVKCVGRGWRRMQ